MTNSTAPYWDGPNALVIEPRDLEKLYSHLPVGFQRQLISQVNCTRRGEKVYVRVTGNLGRRRLADALKAEGLVSP